MFSGDKSDSDNTDPNSTVLVSVREGHALSYFANRKNVIDDNFLLIENLDQRLEDLDDIYSTRFITGAISLINKYGIDYIMLTDKTREYYNLEEINYVKDKKCFNEVYKIDNLRIYESKCVIKKV